MAARLVLLFLILVVQLVDGKKPTCPGGDLTKTGVWERRKSAFGREYKDINDECEHRLAFEKNLRFIADHIKKVIRNPDIFTWQVGENGLADKTDSEFKALLGFKTLLIFDGLTSPNFPAVLANFPAVLATSSSSNDTMIVDYTAEGYVTPVDDQINCGACWAFSATGAVEAQIAMRGQPIPNLSEQHLIDCTNGTYNNSGCEGGYMRNAFKFVKDGGGIVSGDVYPYTGSTDHCLPPSNTKYYTCEGYRVVKPNETELLWALQRYGPIACGIDGSLRSFQLYTSGIYSDRLCTKDLNHAVLVVGAGLDYWLIKNSWGTDWGEYGYGKVLRGVNMCNIIGDCSVPYNCN